MFLILSIFIILLVLYGNLIRIENIDIHISKYSDRNIKIAHISDVHIRKNEHNRINNICKKIKKQNPDIILLTGDIIDSLVFDDSFECFCKSITSIAPTFAVSGNHEELYEDFPKWIDICNQNDIKILNSNFVEYQNLLIAGTDSSRDINFTTSLETVDKSKAVIFLAHRPELFEHYLKGINTLNKPVFVFSGHAHGGQFRFFKRGLYSPQQGLFPKFTSGIYKSNVNPNNKLIVSRGLGHCCIPIRFNNSMHIPIITMHY